MVYPSELEKDSNYDILHLVLTIEVKSIKSRLGSQIALQQSFNFLGFAIGLSLESQIPNSS